ncbi:MAG: DUF4349 domain-containing protein [Firmicutes bacterium]|nr:DUF4349 domain-containing protein [Bacillota bacterium]
MEKAGALLLAAVLAVGAVVTFQSHMQGAASIIANSTFVSATSSNSAAFGAIHAAAQGSMQMAAGNATSTVTSPAPRQAIFAASGRLVEQSASLDLRVQSVPAIRQRLENIIDRDGGFVSSSNQYGLGKNLQVQMTLRVPEAHFASFMRQSQALGTVLNFSQSGQNVTQAYNDNAQQLATLHSELTAYTRLFAKAQSMKDILTIQQAIIQVQSQLADLTGQQQGLLRAVALATVSVTLTPSAFSNTAPQPVITAWNQLLASLGQSGLSLLTLVAWAVPWAILFVIAVFAYRFIANRRKRRSS